MTKKPASRVLITGGAGFIGSNLAEQLAKEGRAVVAVDNFDPYYSRLDKELNVARLRRAGADFRESDIRQYGDIASLIDVAKPDVVVHLAAKAGVRNSVRFPRQYFESNLLGTQNILDSCRALGVERLVVASTSSVYGNTSDTPFSEDQPASDPLHPYAASKRSAEMLCQVYSRLYDLQITVGRFFTVYGESGRPDMMPRQLLESAYFGHQVTVFEGNLSRDWTHVADIAECLRLATDTPLGFQILNFGGGQPVGLQDFIEELEDQSRRRVVATVAPRPPSEMLSTHASTTKLHEYLGFVPSIDVKEGIGRMLDWWQTYLRDVGRSVNPL